MLFDRDAAIAADAQTLSSLVLELIVARASHWPKTGRAGYRWSYSQGKWEMEWGQTTRMLSDAARTQPAFFGDEKVVSVASKRVEVDMVWLQDAV